MVGLSLSLGLSSGRAGGFTPEAEALFARMDVQPDDERKGRINTLVSSLKSAGVWSRLDLLYVLAAHDAQAARLNWVSSDYDCTAVDSPTFIEDRGYVGNGTSSYLDTGFDPATASGANVTQNDNHLSVWVGTDADGSAYFDVGQDALAINSRVGTAVRLRGGNTSSGNVALGVGTAVGWTCFSRTASTDFDTVKDLGTPVNQVRTSSTPVSRNVLIGAINGASKSYSIRRVRAVTLGASLTDTQRDALYSALNTYFNAIEVPEGGDFTRLTNDGNTAWFSDQRGIMAGGALFFSTISGTTSGGNVDLHRLHNGSVTSFRVRDQLEVDDHDNGAVLELTSGKLIHFYNKHSDNRTRYKVSTAAAPDIGGFGEEQHIPALNSIAAYCHPFLLSDGKIYVFRRDNLTTDERHQSMSYAPEADVEAGTATWTTEAIFKRTDQRPYAKYVQNGTDRVDVFITNGHPQEVTDCSLYHCYMQLDAGTPKFYKSDGSEITAERPFDVATECSLIQANTADNTNENWNWDIRIGPDGHPRCLSTRYPTSAATSILTDIEYWHHRWTGTEWTSFRISQNNRSLYGSQSAYAPGLCFDGDDVTTVYLSQTNATTGIAELASYTIDEVEETATLATQITENSSWNNIRPFSPIGHGGDCPLVFIRGQYTSYTDYETRAYAWTPV